MYTRLVEPKQRRATADGLRSLWLYWTWDKDVANDVRDECRERIVAWLAHAGFPGYVFRSSRTGEQLRIRHAEIIKWSRAIVDACSLFIGSNRAGPLRTGLAG